MFYLHLIMRITYFLYIFASVIVVFVFAGYQMLVVLDVPLSDLSPRMYIVPTLVGGLFGYVLAKVRVLQQKLQTNLQALEKREQQLEQEVRERKEIEMELLEKQIRLEEVNRDLEAFSYSASHDLQAPIRSISGFSEILLEECQINGNEENRDYLTRINVASKKMSQLVKALLGLSRASRYEIIKDEVNLSKMVKQIVDELMELHPDQNVNVEIESNMEVYADASLLRVVMSNLLSNAWKYTSKSSAAVIKVGKTTNDREPAIYVQDNGVGFDEQNADKLYLTFQRMHGGDEFQGSGIGLATVKRIIQRHAGRVWAESRPGEGATFYFSLPPKDT